MAYVTHCFSVSLANEDIVSSGLLGADTLSIDYEDSRCNVVYSLGKFILEGKTSDF